MDTDISLKNTAAIILAGGLATRLKERNITSPKSMISFGGSPFLAYVVSSLIQQRFRSVYILAGYKSEVIVDYFGKFPWDQNSIKVLVFDRNGTGGDLLKSLCHINEKELMILNGDTIVDFPVKEVLSYHQKSHADITMVLTRNKHAPNCEAIWVGNDNQVIKSNESTNPDLFSDVLMPAVWKGSSTGIVITDLDVLGSYNYFGGNLSLEGELLPNFIQTRKVIAYDNGGRFFCDFGVPKRYEYIQSNPHILIKVYGNPHTNLSDTN